MSVFAFAAMGPRVFAYSLTGSRWRGSTVTMQLQLGSPSGALLDGATSWGAVAEDALNTWNVNINATKFAVVRDSSATKAKGNRANNVFFSGDIYGDAWGSGVLAVTLTYSSGTSTTESDVLFNSRLSWNSYRGALRGSTNDFRRVAMHEFGHVLGLDHPDENGQSVTALMNSHVSSLDTVAADDISGAQSLYGTPSGATTTSTVAAPIITTQPTSRTVTAGQSTTFTVGVSSTVAVTYQWLKNGGSIAGATSASYTLASVASTDGGNYAVTVANSAGSVTSSSATLTVNATASGSGSTGGSTGGSAGGSTATAPSIITQPVSQTVTAGTNVTFSVVAAGTAPFAYQWRKGGAVVTGATAAAYTISGAQTADAGDYTVTVSNTAGAATSAVAKLTVTTTAAAPPVITAGPIAQTVAAGERASFSVTATGAGSLTYQWIKDNVAIADATGATLTLTAAKPADGGSYRVRVSNTAGSATSEAATLTVKFSRLVNISTRAYVPAGGALTPGFYVRGAAAKPLLIRAVGPTLSLFGVGSALAEARLDVIAQDTATVVASNNDWGGSIALSQIFASVGAFPLAADSKDAAVEASLVPRGYSVRVTAGDDAAAGITLAEIYDTDSAAASSSQLVNVSTLGFVGSGDQVLTAGFVISGNTTKRLLIRAVGPGLTQFGISDALADPQLGLVPLGGSEPIATNDNWPNLPNLQVAFTAAGAFALTPNSKDAAMTITLEPGAYTVIVSGVTAGATGTALVEIYDLDP